MLELKAVLNLIQDFLSPASKLDQSSLNEISLDTILRSLLDQFASKNSDFFSSLNIDTDMDSYWTFGLLSLQLLDALDSSQSNKDQLELLSIAEERLLSTLCQLVTSFGIHLNLEDNVGVGIERLSKYGANIRLKRDQLTPWSKKPTLG